MPKKEEYRSKRKPKPESDGWVLCVKYKPEPYAVVRVRDINNHIGTAWWTGWKWDFGVQRTFARIEKWQRLKEKIV